MIHYELEFIHPFSDGNGRMGRLWHSLILYLYHPLFAQVPIESMIKARQSDYYRVLGECDKEGKSSRFIQFSLEVTLEALREIEQPIDRMSGSDRVEAARIALGSALFSRKDYWARYPGISSATASRDLKRAVTDKVLEVEHAKALTRYRFT